MSSPAANAAALWKRRSGFGATARSTDDVPLGVTSKAAFTVVAEPAAQSQTTSRSTTSRISRDSGGGTVGSGSWGAVERYYLRLMNCTRTGGWVTSGGDCSSPGGRSVAPLKLDSGISTKVARPYAKKLAVNNMCTHFSGGTPGDRLRRDAVIAGDHEDADGHVRSPQLVCSAKLGRRRRGPVVINACHRPASRRMTSSLRALDSRKRA